MTNNAGKRKQVAFAGRWRRAMVEDQSGTLDANAVSALLALSAYLTESGEVSLSYTRLAKCMRKSEATAKRGIHSAIKAGWLVRTKRGHYVSAEVGGYANRYQVTIPLAMDESQQVTHEPLASTPNGSKQEANRSKQGANGSPVIRQQVTHDPLKVTKGSDRKGASFKDHSSLRSSASANATASDLASAESADIEIDDMCDICGGDIGDLSGAYLDNDMGDDDNGVCSECAKEFRVFRIRSARGTYEEDAVEFSYKLERRRRQKLAS